MGTHYFEQHGVSLGKTQHFVQKKHSILSSKIPCFETVLIIREFLGEDNGMTREF